MPIEPIVRRPRFAIKSVLRDIALIFALLVLIVVGALYVQVDGRAQVDAARPVDTIIVLGAAVWSGGIPGPSLYARTQHAIALYRAGYASHLILSGGLGKYPPAEAEAMRALALAAGVPEQALVLEDRSHSTEENLANSKALMDARGWRSALLVSDPFHLLRAERIARDLGIDAFGSPARNSPNYMILEQRVYYTTREALALVWYYTTQVVGEPTWLYAILKGRI